MNIYSRICNDVVTIRLSPLSLLTPLLRILVFIHLLMAVIIPLMVMSPPGEGRV